MYIHLWLLQPDSIHMYIATPHSNLARASQEDGVDRGAAACPPHTWLQGELVRIAAFVFVTKFMTFFCSWCCSVLQRVLQRVLPWVLQKVCSVFVTKFVTNFARVSTGSHVPWFCCDYLRIAKNVYAFTHTHTQARTRAHTHMHTHTGARCAQAYTHARVHKHLHNTYEWRGTYTNMPTHCTTYCNTHYNTHCNAQHNTHCNTDRCTRELVPMQTYAHTSKQL